MDIKMPERCDQQRPLVIQVAAERIKEGRPRSIQVYAEAIRTRLEARGVRLIDTPYEETRMLPEADIVWAPGLGNRRVPRSVFAAGARGVATVHGLQLIENGLEIGRLGVRQGLSHYLWRTRIRHDWARLGAKIGSAISVSEALRPQVTGALKVPTDRITVIGHGVSRDFFREPGQNGQRQDYILHVSQYSPVKNISGLLAAYDKVRDRIGLPLRIVSGNWPGDPASLPQGVEMTTDLVPHDKVRELMWGARVFLFPSFEEAFGLPVLEAMASGVPVVTSVGTGAAEVVGAGGLCVDPNDTDAIANALLAAATDATLHTRLARAGYERAKGFDWDIAADRHLALFQRLAGRLPTPV
ncbi:glycosyltransferase [Tabrizicola sp. WMC-M-20]|nr:glycosyltransferase [Tabrizicola sp. WMC-M-20]